MMHLKYIKLFENFDNISSIEELINKLKEYSIPIEEYGTGQSKTIGHLFKELQEGECHIKEENGNLNRYIDFVGVKLYYQDKNGVNWFLIEDRQEFKDGRTRKRSIKASVAEKMIQGEDPLESAMRGLEEELNIKIFKDQIQQMDTLHYEEDSKSYLGLRTKYTEYPFICHLNDTQFNPEGYVEHQKDKSTFFKWIKM